MTIGTAEFGLRDTPEKILECIKGSKKDPTQEDLLKELGIEIIDEPGETRLTQSLCLLIREGYIGSRRRIDLPGLKFGHYLTEKGKAGTQQTVAALS